MFSISNTPEVRGAEYAAKYLGGKDIGKYPAYPAPELRGAKITVTALRGIFTQLPF